MAMDDRPDRIDIGRLAIPSFAVVVVVFAGLRLLSIEPWAMPAYDAYAYWLTGAGVDYSATFQGATGAYLYSPAFAQLIAPLAALPWPVFLALWTLLIAAPLAWLAGRYALPLLVLPPVFMSVALGQLDLAFAAVVLLGLRWPALWALPILTKITPGIGLLWFLVRGEWRSLGIEALATPAIALASSVVHPSPRGERACGGGRRSGRRGRLDRDARPDGLPGAWRRPVVPATPAGLPALRRRGAHRLGRGHRPPLGRARRGLPLVADRL